jgi:DNA processing protein
LKNGAKLVESAADILQELNLEISERNEMKKIYEPKTEEEKIIWRVLSSDPLHVDRIAKLTKLNPAVVGSTLAMMEIEEAVRNVGGQYYIKM